MKLKIGDVTLDYHNQINFNTKTQNIASRIETKNVINNYPKFVANGKATDDFTLNIEINLQPKLEKLLEYCRQQKKVTYADVQGDVMSVMILSINVTQTNILPIGVGGKQVYSIKLAKYYR